MLSAPSKPSVIWALTLATLTVLPGLSFAVGSAPAAEPASNSETIAWAEPQISFERDVHPILKAYCTHCHGEEEDVRGNLDLRLRRSILHGGDSGTAMIPGDPRASLLLERVIAGEMPPEDATKRPTPSEIATLRRWIATGARTQAEEPQRIGRGMLITEEDRNWWSFQPVQRPDVPTVRNRHLVRTPIDAFVLSRLEQAGYTFSSEADRKTLIRRASWSLTGLPPRQETVKAFLADASPLAWERLVDRLLSSPHYGEHWGRHWLDLAGYADSEGVTEADAERPWAWKYRDYVIRSFNTNKPYDGFVREQIAGDEINFAARAEVTGSERRPPPAVSLATLTNADSLTPLEVERLTATGFLRMAPDGTASANVEKATAANQTIADSLQIVSGTLLGLTVECAQCHEHRYDPIPQADYYRFRAIFEPAFHWQKWKTPPQRLLSLETSADRKAAARLEAEAAKIDKARLQRQSELIAAVFEREVKKLPADLQAAARKARDTTAKKRTKAQQQLLKDYPSLNVSAGSLYLYDSQAAKELKEFSSRASAVRAKKPQREFVRALIEHPGTQPESFVFIRGDYQQAGETVTPGGLSILQADASQSRIEISPNNAELATTGRRLEYARQLTNGHHPLLARVFVNRVWQHHFGRGLVSTPGDFGRLGEKPSHPLLLDWLADEFVRSGWNVKALHRLILTSAVWQQSLRTNRELIQHDPENRLFGGARIRRLSAEAIRDGMLAVSGRLNAKPFGKPIPVMADRDGQWVIGIENLNAGRPGPVIPMHGEEHRRSVYVQVRRSRPLSVLETFDAPRMEPHCQLRAASTVAPQALTLLNGSFVLSQAQALAMAVDFKPAESPDAELIQTLWQRVYSRSATDEEVHSALAFLAEQTEELETRLQSKAKNENRGKARREALASLCQMLLGSNEFLYVD